MSNQEEITQDEALGMACAGLGDRTIAVTTASPVEGSRIIVFRFNGADGSPQELSVEYWRDRDYSGSGSRRLLEMAIEHVALAYDKQKKLAVVRNADLVNP